MSFAPIDLLVSPATRAYLSLHPLHEPEKNSPLLFPGVAADGTLEAVLGKFPIQIGYFPFGHGYSLRLKGDLSE